MNVEPAKPWNPPSKASINFERLVGVVTLAQGGATIVLHGRKLLVPWLVSVVSWFTLCKYLICTHCEHHGEYCEFYGLGKHAATLFPEKRKSSLSPFGWLTEGISMAGMLLLPFCTVGKSGVKWILIYSISVIASYASMFIVSCRHCALTATDRWKSLCPNYRIARRIWR
ncbi:MAG: hypothetical protein JW738_06415 [Actinobacteria bacterium]|nr:hypothetical protein [Actinomycetota bacterium]